MSLLLISIANIISKSLYGNERICVSRCLDSNNVSDRH